MPRLSNRDDLTEQLSSAPAAAPSVGNGDSGSPEKSASVVLGLVSALASVVGNIYVNTRNREAAQEQNQWNLEQWNRENRYNDPRNQMARLAAAGINPALAYANGDLMNEAASSPQMTSSLGNITSPVQIDPLTAAQIRNLDAQTDKTDAETKTEEQLRQARYDQLAAATKNLYEQNKEITARIERYVHENGLTDVQRDKIKFDRMMQGKYYMIDKQKLQNETNLTNKQIEKLGADIRKALAEARVTDREYNEMIWTYAMRKSKLYNEVNLTQAKIDEARATARKLGIEADLDSPMAVLRRREAFDLSNGNVLGIALYSIYDVIDNTAGSIFH